MMGFFPMPYEDELLYSQLCRYHVRSGHSQYLQTVDDLFNHRTVRPNIEFINSYTADALDWICCGVPFRAVVNERTMIPTYVRFLQKDRRISAYKAVDAMEGNWRNVFAVPNDGEVKLKYCPICATEDRKKYGETYWHRTHQIEKIRVCPKHRCYLSESEISIASRISPNFYDAENFVPRESEIRVCENITEINFSQYMVEVMKETIDLKSDYPIGLYLHLNLGSDYLSQSHLARNMVKLADDYKEFYKGMFSYDASQIQKILDGHRCSFYAVCQMAFFEGITVYDLTHLPTKVPMSGIEELYKNLSEKYGIELQTVRMISKEVLDFNKRKVGKKSYKIRDTNWALLDNETFPKVKEAVDKCFCIKMKPQRVSVSAIERRLKIRQKQIKRMPKCSSYIYAHMETQQEYWARKIEWAIKELECFGYPISLNRICKKTSIRQSDIGTAYKHIKDSEVKRKVAEMIDYKKPTTM